MIIIAHNIITDKRRVFLLGSKQTESMEEETPTTEQNEQTVDEQVCQNYQRSLILFMTCNICIDSDYGVEHPFLTQTPRQ